MQNGYATEARALTYYCETCPGEVSNLWLPEIHLTITVHTLQQACPSSSPTTAVDCRYGLGKLLYSLPLSFITQNRGIVIAPTFLDGSEDQGH